MKEEITELKQEITGMKAVNGSFSIPHCIYIVDLVPFTHLEGKYCILFLDLKTTIIIQQNMVNGKTLSVPAYLHYIYLYLQKQYEH